MQSLIDTLLEAPASHMDEFVKDDIRKWGSDPTPFQILETLDKVVWASGASDFVVGVMDIILREKIEHVGMTFEQFVKLPQVIESRRKLSEIV